MGERDERRSMETLAVHAGERRPGPEGSLVYPLYQGTVFGFPPGTSYDDLRYIRLGTNPTQEYLHDRLAALEGGEAAVATASGMAALATTLLSFLKRGDHLLAGSCLYGGTHALLTHHFDDLGLAYTFVDAQRPETWSAARRPSTRAFLVETITNPLMRVPPLRAVVDFARREGLTTVIDNTFASPVNCRPLALGFDLVIHSATKYLNGHSDLVGGCIIGGRAPVARAKHALSHFGGSMDPHTGWLLSRGLKTLALRVRAQNASALALARFLAEQPEVAAVNYPGLPTHPDHAHARELLSGFGGMLSFRLRGGLGAAERLCEALRLPFLAPSLGGVETLIVRPSVTSHARLTPAERDAIGVTDDLVRLSVGIEGTDDLIADFRQALARAGS